MKTDQHASPISINDLWRTAIRRLAWLRAKMTIGIDVSRALQDFHGVLESLPLSTSEFGLARNRLNNAVKYLASAESGAARYELRLLETSLRLWAGVLTATYRPQHRMRARQPSHPRF
jgi:hypothetical protein